jgi:cell division septum initiation protein DivIVA
LAEVAAAVDRLNTELAKILMERKAATTGADELRRQLEAANAKIAEFHQKESLLSKAVLDVQKVTEEMTESSQAEAERIVADAKATVEEMMQTARKEAADLLRDARARGQEAVRAAERAAATQVAQVEEEAERLLEQARQQARELQEAAEQRLQGLITRVEGALSDGDRTGFFRQLEVLSETHAAALETVEGLQAEVTDILPKLRQLLEDLKAGRTSPAAAAAPAASAAGGLRRRAFTRPVTAPAPPPEVPEPVVLPQSIAPPVFAASVPAPQHEPERPPEVPSPVAPPPPDVVPEAVQPRGEAVAPQPAARAGGERDWNTMPKGEVVVSPVSSYLQASKLITAISRMTGVKAVRLRTYAAGVVTIEVATETGTLSGFDTAHIDGFPLDVVEATDTRLVLRFNKGSSHAKAR